MSTSVVKSTSQVARSDLGAEMEALATAVGIADPAAFLRAFLGALAGGGAQGAGGDIRPRRRLSIEEVAAELQVSVRWLADQCRTDQVEHVHLARKRFFTEAQVDKLLEANTVKPFVVAEAQSVAERVARRLAHGNRR
jgi:hypothetical protein